MLTWHLEVKCSSQWEGERDHLLQLLRHLTGSPSPLVSCSDGHILAELGQHHPFCNLASLWGGRKCMDTKPQGGKWVPSQSVATETGPTCWCHQVWWSFSTLMPLHPQCWGDTFTPSRRFGEPPSLLASLSHFPTCVSWDHLPNKLLVLKPFSQVYIWGTQTKRADNGQKWSDKWDPGAPLQKPR